MNEKILLKNTEGGPVDFETYRTNGGYQALEAVLREKTSEEVIDVIKRSGLRGHGGAGFPTGKKWEMVANHRDPERYLVCNAGEHEPGTFKDRHLLKVNPHQLIEGIIIGTRVVSAKEPTIFIDGDFKDEIASLQGAIDAARGAGFLGEGILGTDFSCEIKIFRGPHTYVAGEETALLEAMQGREPKPKPKPPHYPTVHGLYGKPTLVNNVETFSNVPHILRRGAEWYRSMGTETCPGTMLFSISGDVNRPGVYELPFGTPLRTLVYEYGGGIKNGNLLKAVYPGGPSQAFLLPRDLDTPLDFETLKKKGTGLGSAGVIVVDDTRCMVEKTMTFCRFFEVESCGQCPPCKMGTHYLHQTLEKIESGNGKPEDLETLKQLSGFVMGRGECTVVSSAAIAVKAALEHFHGEFETHLREGRCTLQVAG